MSDREPAPKPLDCHATCPHPSLIIVAIALLIGSYFWFDLGQYFSLDELRERRDQLMTFIDRNFYGMLALYMAVYIVMAALSLPGAAI